MRCSGLPDPAPPPPPHGSLPRAPQALARLHKPRGSPRKGELLSQGQTEPQGWEREGQDHAYSPFRSGSEGKPGCESTGIQDGSRDRQGLGGGEGKSVLGRGGRVWGGGLMGIEREVGKGCAVSPRHLPGLIPSCCVCVWGGCLEGSAWWGGTASQTGGLSHVLSP